MSTKPIHDNGIARIVERQMRNWEIARAQRLVETRTPPPSVQDFVSVSRQVGAGGTDVASRIAHRLAWPLFDREILHAMAGDDAIREQIYSSMDERDLGWLEESCRSVAQTGFTRNDYFHELTRTVLTLARQGSAVFLGRATDLILPRDRGFRMRVVAPLDYRARSYATRRGVSLDDATQVVEEIEGERAAFIRRHFQRDAEDLTRHDLIINMERFSPDQATDVALAAMQARGMAVIGQT